MVSRHRPISDNDVTSPKLMLTPAKHFSNNTLKPGPLYGARDLLPANDHSQSSPALRRTTGPG